MQTYLLFEETNLVTGKDKELSSPCSYQATVEGTGAVSATVIVEATNDGKVYRTLATFTLSGTNVASDDFSSNVRWYRVRARVTARAGTGAKVTVTAGA